MDYDNFGSTFQYAGLYQHDSNGFKKKMFTKSYKEDLLESVKALAVLLWQSEATMWWFVIFLIVSGLAYEKATI